MHLMDGCNIHDPDLKVIDATKLPASPVSVMARDYHHLVAGPMGVT
jgi:hypothetical protein